MPTKDLRGKIAIVGACETDKLGTLPGHSMITLHAEGIRNALDDAGLRLSDVDGLLCPGIPMTQLSEYLGITPRLYNNTQMGGCSFIAMVEHAMLALDAGFINVAVISHGESGRSRIGVAAPGGAASLPGGQFRGPLRHLRRADDLLPARHAPHARLRHHPGAIRGGVGLHPEVGPDAPQGRHEGRPHRRRSSQLPHGLLALHPLHVLPRHRRRRRARAHPRR